MLIMMESSNIVKSKIVFGLLKMLGELITVHGIQLLLNNSVYHVNQMYVNIWIVMNSLIMSLYS